MDPMSINKLKPLEELQFSSYTQISLQFHWCVCLAAQSCPTLCNPMDCKPLRLLCQWDSPGKNTGVGSHSLLQGIFLT